MKTASNKIKLGKFKSFTDFSPFYLGALMAPCSCEVNVRGFVTISKEITSNLYTPSSVVLAGKQTTEHCCGLTVFINVHC